MRKLLCLLILCLVLVMSCKLDLASGFWGKKTVVLDGNQGNLSSSKAIENEGLIGGLLEVTSGESYNGLPTPTKAGYTFDGWYTKRIGGERVDNNSTVGFENCLYAHWISNSDKQDMFNNVVLNYWGDNNLYLKPQGEVGFSNFMDAVRNINSPDNQSSQWSISEQGSTVHLEVLVESCSNWSTAARQNIFTVDLEGNYIYATYPVSYSLCMPCPTCNENHDYTDLSATLNFTFERVGEGSDYEGVWKAINAVHTSWNGNGSPLCEDFANHYFPTINYQNGENNLNLVISSTGFFSIMGFLGKNNYFVEGNLVNTSGGQKAQLASSFFDSYNYDCTIQGEEPVWENEEVFPKSLRFTGYDSVTNAPVLYEIFKDHVRYYPSYVPNQYNAATQTETRRFYKPDEYEVLELKTENGCLYIDNKKIQFPAEESFEEWLRNNADIFQAVCVDQSCIGEVLCSRDFIMIGDVRFWPWPTKFLW